MADQSAGDLYEAALARLKDKRAAFVREYLVDLNATAAAKRAGYAAKGARQEGSRLLSNADIAEAIRLGREARGVRLEITADAVVLELARIAFADLRRAVTWGPGTVALVESHLIDDDTARAIAEIGQSEHGPRLKLAPKLPALERLGRHLGLWVDDDKDAKAADAAAIVAVLEAARLRVERARAPMLEHGAGHD